MKPERDQNNRDSYRQKWWIHGEPRKDLRPALAGHPRYITTVETSKHRFFTFLDQEILPDNKLIAIASDDAYVLGILSAGLHVKWSLVTGSWLGVGNDSVYVKSRCFEPFPFPALSESPLKQRIRDLGERLDAHRKTQQALHPDLTLTGMYNVLEAVRAGTPLTAKEKAIHDKGLVSILQQIHDELDAAVLEAYGWSDLAGTALRSGPANEAPLDSAEAPGDKDLPILTPCAGPPGGRSLPSPGPPGGRSLPSDALLTRLVALNHARAAEEKTGLIRWLRPDYQNPARSGDANSADHRPPLQGDLIGTETAKTAKPGKPAVALAWPATLSAQVTAIQKLISTHGQDTETLSSLFGKKVAKRTQQIAEIVETLKAIGQL